MKPIAAALVAVLALAGPALGQSRAAEAALAASDRLAAAAELLAGAERQRDRVAALTETVRAYEDGLAALRDGLRQAAIRQRSIETRLNSEAEDVAQLLAVLQTMGRAPAPILLLHPSGPLGTARSGMMLADVTPALQTRVEELRIQLEEVALLRQLQEKAAETLNEGLEGAQTARAALTAAISDRTDLPRRFTEDPVQTALLMASTETLEAFATGLTLDDAADPNVAAPDSSARMGELSLPVQGSILRGFEEADAAGVVRPGWVIATRPRALVTTPVAATLRFRGPLLDYGNVVIIEPAPGTLFVIAGLAEVFGEAGEVLPEGSPIGLVGGEVPASDEILTESAEAAAPIQTETLYLEVRDGQGPVNPADWFAAQ